MSLGRDIIISLGPKTITIPYDRRLAEELQQTAIGPDFLVIRIPVQDDTTDRTPAVELHLPQTQHLVELIGNAIWQARFSTLPDSDAIGLLMRPLPELLPERSAIPVKERHLRRRILSLVDMLGVTTTYEIVTKTPRELFRYKNFGRTSMAKLEEWLELHRLFLGMYVPERIRRPILNRLPPRPAPRWTIRDLVDH